MTENKNITMWIERSDEDAAFIGYCPQFFPYGAVCHGHTEAIAIAKLAAIVRDELGEQTLRRTRGCRGKKSLHDPARGDVQYPQKSCNLTPRDGSCSANWSASKSSNFRNTLLTKPFGLSKQSIKQLFPFSHSLVSISQC